MAERETTQGPVIHVDGDGVVTIPKRVVIIGGTGFLGSQLTRVLRDAGHQVIVASRHPAGGNGSVAADVRLSETLFAAIAGAEVVINCVSLYRETAGITFEDVHVLGARNVAYTARESGVDILIHVSGIGADRTSVSPYVCSRGKGEQVVRKAFPGAVILRPCAMIGPGEDLLASIAAIPRWLPALPLFGNGSACLQPVHTQDVADAVRHIIETGGMEGRTCELGGPDVMSYAELLRLVKKLRGDRRPVMPFPMNGWQVLAETAGAFGALPVTEGEVALMRRDTVADNHLPGLAELGVLDPISVEETAQLRYG